MIERNRARERVSFPALNRYVTLKGPFDDLITQALIDHSKMRDDIPESPDFIQFVSTNFIQRSLVYPLVHVGDKWVVWTKVPTAMGYITNASQAVGAGVEYQFALFSGLGIFRWFTVTGTLLYKFEVILKVDGVEIYRQLIETLLEYGASDYSDGMIKVVRNDSYDSAQVVISLKEFHFRQTFQVILKNTHSSGTTLTSFKALAEMHGIGW
jgi:hypothetical protein